MSFSFLAAFLLSVGDSKRVEIVALDAETGKPLEKAVIRVFNGIRPTPYVFTDAAGKATVEYPPGGDLTIDVHTTKHIQQRVTFKEIKPQPAAMTLQLRRGIRTVGGLVVDEDGKPVAGAMVRFGAYLGEPQRAPGNTELVCDIDAVTDSDGRWSVKCLDNRPYSLHVSAKHPDFVYNRHDLPAVGSQKLLAGTAKTVLKRGVLVRGKVRDDHGRPIAGASVVAAGKFGSVDDTSPLVLTGADGGFKMHLPPGRNLLTLQASDRSPIFRLMELSDEPAALTFTMPAGRTVRGRVLDTEDRPVVGVNVYAKFDGLPNMSGLRLFDLTDDDGAFELKDVPAESFTLAAYREGWLPTQAAMPPDRNEYTFVVKRGLPPGASFLLNDLKRGRPSKKPMPGDLIGVVTEPDGKPAAGAIILLATKEEAMGWFADGAIVNESSSVNFMTDEQGRFSLPLQGQPYALAVSHDDGWALWRPASDRNRREPPEIKLTPWATIKGTFLLNGKREPKLTLRYYMDHSIDLKDQRSRLHFITNAETDFEGRFVMTRVPAVPGRLKRYMRIVTNSQTSADIVRLDPKPGETLEVGEVRQQGRTVVGRLKLPPELRPNESEYRLGFVCLPGDADANSDRLRIPYPKELEGKPRSVRIDWRQKWLSTPEGRAYGLAYQRLRVDVEPDGRFRMDGANADSYLLNVNLRAPALDVHERGEVLAFAEKKFVVPPMPRGYEDEPLDIGEVDVVMSKATRTGEKLADFSAKTLDGKQWKLSSDAKKVRILDFWATWCGPCHEAIPELAALHEELGGEGLVIVGVSIDDDPADAAALVREKRCDWRQVHIGPKSPLLETLGVNSFPTFIVVDRNGKICYRGNYASSAGQAARQVLSR